MRLGELRRWRSAGLGAIAVVLALGVAAGLSSTLSPFFVYLSISAVVTTILLLGLGVVTGDAGMIALCQLSFAAIGAWTVSWLNQAHAPGGLIVWLAAAAGVAGLGGVLIGSPALRLRGINLAVVTLGFSAVVDIVLAATPFPGAAAGVTVPRPAPFESDRAYLFLCLVVLIVAAVAVIALRRSRFGVGLRTFSFSERAAAASGASVARLKLGAFAISAAMAGVAGGLITGQIGAAYADSFATIPSLALYLLTIVVGTQYIEMAVLGGIMWVFMPVLLKSWGLSQDWALVLFGVLGIQAIASGSSLGKVVRERIARHRSGRVLRDRSIAAPETGDANKEPGSPSPAPSFDSGAEPVLRVRGLRVQYGAIAALDGVDIDIRSGIVTGLIGPNGAGKSTFVDALSGFITVYDGTIELDGESLHGLTAAGRARLGIRRTFQQGRVAPSLSVGEYIEFASGGRLSGPDVEELLASFGCPPAPTRIAAVDAGTRRLIEVAGQLAARPKVLVLDEPAAGLSHDEHLALALRLKRVPAEFGVALLVIEHDLDLVRTTCDRVTVLDFGKVIADGTVSDVLADPDVLAAYMGEAPL
jgi:branched-chain amino acid transport system permease protein